MDGLVLLMRALLADGVMHSLDPTVPPLPFRDELYAHPVTHTSRSFIAF